MTSTEAHALVIDRILALPNKSPEGNAAHQAYQSVRLGIVPKLLKQKQLLEQAILRGGVTSDLDLQVVALDESIAADWTALDTKLCEALR